ncbi:MAG: pyridoxal phosphate-dependent aminotransferase [Pseudomonadota bacterium]
MSAARIASRVAQLRPSGIRAIMALASEREAKGEPVLHLEVGQPDFPVPSHVREAVADGVRSGLPGYTPNLGMPELRAAIAERTYERTAIKTAPANVAVTTGAVNALSLAILAMIEPGDEVIVPDPGWPNYESAIALAGGVPVPIQLDPSRGFAMSREALEAVMTPRSRMIMTNSPGNPTGAVAGRAELEAVCDIADTHDLLVLSDEIYEDFVFDGQYISAREVCDPARVIVVSGASKSYAMTGYRLGWLIADAGIVDAVGALVEPLTSCPSSVAQVAALHALQGPQDDVAEMRAAFHRRAGLVEDRLQGADMLVAPAQGAFYVMADISGAGLDSDTFAEALLRDTGIAVAPGATFGDTSRAWVRLSVATDDETVRRGVESLVKYVRERTGS